MKMNKKYTILFTALLLGLTLSGVAYAHWSKIIYIDGKVDTGKFHLTPFVTNYWWELQEKEVAYWGVETDWCGADNTIDIELKNVYPCTGIHIDFMLLNDGTIPAGLKEIRKVFLDYLAPDGTWQPYSCDVSQPVLGPDADGDGVPDSIVLSIYTAGNMGDFDEKIAILAITAIDASDHTYPGAPPNSWIQIDDGEAAYCHINLHFWEGLPQGMSFRFRVELEYWNWNEV